MNKIKGLLSMVVMCVALSACGAKGPQEIVSNELGIDVSKGVEISDVDTHAGFHGDGVTCIALRFEDESVLDSIKENSDWKELPLDETMQALVYGMEDATGEIGPFLNDNEGNALLPEIQNGYYLLIDRHADKNSDILERGSFNFTVGLYDTDNNIIYFCKLDT